MMIMILCNFSPALSSFHHMPCYAKKTDRSSVTPSLPALHHPAYRQTPQKFTNPPQPNMHDITSHTVTLRHRVFPSPTQSQFFSWTLQRCPPLISSPRPRNEAPTTSQPALPWRIDHMLQALAGITLIAVRHTKCQVMQQAANQRHNYRRCQLLFFCLICCRDDDVCVLYVSLILAILNLFLSVVV